MIATLHLQGAKGAFLAYGQLLDSLQIHLRERNMVHGHYHVVSLQPPVVMCSKPWYDLLNINIGASG